MILINFSHPLSRTQQEELQQLTGQTITRLVEQPVQFEVEQPFAPQVAALVDRLGLSPTEWQTEPLLLLLPSLNFGAAILLAELHGRCGYFPTIIRTRPVSNNLSTRYEVAEIINLQAVRDEARLKRKGGSK